MAPCDGGAKGREEGDHPGVEARADPARRMMKGRDKERDADRKEQQALEDAKGAGLEPHDELEVVAEGEHPRTGKEPEEIA